MKVIDFDGTVLDATFSVQPPEGGVVSVVFESSGGHEGGPEEPPVPPWALVCDRSRFSRAAASSVIAKWVPRQAILCPPPKESMQAPGDALVS
jgi:hypothetical protein